MDKKLFLFDCDGVLVDSLQVFEGTVRECLDVIGQPILKSREDFLDLFDDNFYSAIVRKGVDLDAFMRAAGPILARVNYTEMNPVGGLLPVIAAMNRRHCLAIISSGGEKTIRNQLTHFGFDGCFRTILGSDFLLSKIDKINHAVSAFQVDKDQAYYVGDTAGDIREAKTAGIRTVAVTWGWHTRERLTASQPDYLFDKPEDLLGI
ncbi:MAG: HAD family hydrolase [Pseudomonadota bacterium]